MLPLNLQLSVVIYAKKYFLQTILAGKITHSLWLFDCKTGPKVS